MERNYESQKQTEKLNPSRICQVPCSRIESRLFVVNIQLLESPAGKRREKKKKGEKTEGKTEYEVTSVLTRLTDAEDAGASFCQQRRDQMPGPQKW